MRDDLRAALRSLGSSRSFTVASLLVLTLGVGATTAIFSVVDAVVLRGLPFDGHDRLVAVGQRTEAAAHGPGPNPDPAAIRSAAPQNYLDWVEQQQVFESMAAIASGWLTLREPGGEPESLVPQRVTAGFFDVLRVRPTLGRPFTSENEVAGRHQVAVLSDGLWRRRFGADPQILGRRIPLESLEGDRAANESGGYEVIGVMPAGFSYPVGATRPTDIWIPYVVSAEERQRDPAWQSNYLQVIARLKPGVSVVQAQAQMDRVAAAIEAANPVWNKGSRIGVRPLIDHVVGARIKSWMLMLLGAVAMVLLIACANIANLLLARASTREREIGIRAALGAGRIRLVRQLLVESLLLSAAGTVLAVIVAWWAVQVLRDGMPDGVPRVTTIALNVRVLAAAAAASIVTGLLFGIVPALHLSRPDLTAALKDGARDSTVGRKRQHMRGVLIVAEVAIALVLVVGAALFIGSFVSLARIDPGFEPERVLLAQIAPRVESRQQLRDSGPLVAQLLDRLDGIPGIVHASIINGGVPLSGGMNMTTFVVPGRIDLSAAEPVSTRRVSPAYHQALGIPLRRGRLFTAGDRRDAPKVVIINEAAARKYFPGEDPIGQIVSISGEMRVVGVVGDVRQTALELSPEPEAYMPLAQAPVYGAELVIRTSGDPYDVLPAVKSAVYALFPDVPLRNVRSMQETIARSMATRRFNMLLLGLFGVLGLVIAAVGIYGTMAYLVSQRTREIGVRIALGATPPAVVALVARHACMLVAIGVVIGTVAAWYLSAASKAFLFNVEPTDPRAFLAGVAALALAALAASVIPARRAASVDPMIALRAE